jgi:phosphoribosylanthranilate isomerase
MRFPVKVCGITRPGDASLAAECGAWAVGMIFIPSSPRFVNARQARAISESVPKDVLRVGVFMNHSAEVIRRIEEEVPLDLIQLHGRETNETCMAVGKERVIKSVVLREAENVNTVMKYEVAYLLADRPKSNPQEKVPQGLARELARRHSRILLAGGLTPENVGKAIHEVRPWGVDVASGVESVPGVKDAAKLEAFFAAVRRVSEEEAQA